MRGDFSTWNKDRSQNFRGTLHQQGRVLLDRDWNAQTEVFNEWQETAGRDAFGAGVAAVPAEVPQSFRVTETKIDAGVVKISANKGRVWADGLLVESAEDITNRVATYLNLPPATVPNPANTPRDTVILETWLEELSPFQKPALLIEPALGGVDTTERVHTAFRFRLFRMAAGETCDSIISKLKDNFSLKGKLTAKLNATVNIDGDCPVVESGGYTGFEHRLYRIEIADKKTSIAGSWFKWSQFNGGLVGRGFFDAANNKVVIKANENAIVHSGISSFYLEAMEFDPELGHWRVIYGAKNVTLAADRTLTLPAAVGDKFIGNIPPSPAGTEKIYFFRLWNGIERVNNFTAAAGTDLPDLLGIKLQFEAEAAGKYTAHDFWTFSVRAGEIGNVTPLIDNKPPEGIFYHRVPLAEVNWTGNVVTGDEIEDCRRVFQPLTKLKTCCTYRVGDGTHSHGDFTRIQDAINALPKVGGEVCILPGLYEENVVLKTPHNKNIILKGCGNRTVIKAKNNDALIPETDPKYNAAIYVKHGQNICIESLAVEAHDEGIGILLEGEEKTAKGDTSEKYLKDIVLSHLFVKAAKNYAIKGHIAQFLTLSNSTIYIKDMDARCSAVYLAGDDMLIERCEIRVLSARAAAAAGDEITNDPNLFFPAQMATGGLQIGGGSERVRIIDNLIISGIGNGITLGSIDFENDGVIVTNHNPFGSGNNHPIDICNPDDGYVDDDEETDDGMKPVAGPPLEDILIKFNRIFNMGRNGIGVATFFGLGDKAALSHPSALDELAVKGVIVVSKLVISENRIERCMNISPQPIKDKMSHLMGYGGIALAVVENLVIRDNFIVDNCRDLRDPICGIYVLATIGLEISRNDITEHLPQNFEDVNATNVKIGPRGGIWVFIATGQMDAFSGSSYDRHQKAGVFRQSSGAHAAKIHENVVSTPLGRSLTLMILGDVSILGNRFTSFGIVPVDILKLFVSIFINKGLNMSGFLQLLSLLAGNVLIFDLGSFVVYREYKKIEAAGMKLNEFNFAATNKPEGDEVKQTGLSRLINLFTRAGLIHFSDNQCKLSPQGREISIAFSSILIVGLADIGFHDNQSSCSIPKSLLITNAALLGGTSRATGNWLKETFMHVGFSAITFGLLNSTTDNESVHCLRIAGMQYLDRHNLVLGGILAGVTGDIAEEDGNKLRELCKSQKGFARVGMQMWRAVMQDQDEADLNKMTGSFIRTRRGG